MSTSQPSRPVHVSGLGKDARPCLPLRSGERSTAVPAIPTPLTDSSPRILPAAGSGARFQPGRVPRGAWEPWVRGPEPGEGSTLAVGQCLEGALGSHPQGRIWPRPPNHKFTEERTKSVALVISTPHRGAEPHEGGHTVNAHGCISGARKRAPNVGDTHKQSRQRMTLMPVLGYAPCPSPHSIRMVPEGAVTVPGHDLVPQTADRFRIKHLTRAGSSTPCPTQLNHGRGREGQTGQEVGPPGSCVLAHGLPRV